MSGQEKFRDRDLVLNYKHNANAAILVYDITNRESFENLKASQGPNNPRTELSMQRLAALYKAEHKLDEAASLRSRGASKPE